MVVAPEFACSYREPALSYVKNRRKIVRFEEPMIPTSVGLGNIDSKVSYM
jgi:hypothetical protein